MKPQQNTNHKPRRQRNILALVPPNHGVKKDKALIRALELRLHETRNQKMLIPRKPITHKEFLDFFEIAVLMMSECSRYPYIKL